MAKDRETLNDRYMVKPYRPTPDMVAWVGFPGWYVLLEKMKEDGIDSDDIGTTSEDGYTNPVLQWNDNRSIYVDHKP